MSSPAARGDACPHQPVIELVHEAPYPDDPTRCVLWWGQDGVQARVNTAHGEDGYLHVVYHAEQPIAGLVTLCRTDQPCGYEADDEPEGLWSRADRPPVIG